MAGPPDVGATILPSAGVLSHHCHYPCSLHLSANNVSSATAPAEAGGSMKGGTYLLIIIAVLMAVAIALASGYPYIQSKLLPIMAGGVVFILSVAELVRDLRAERKAAGPRNTVDTKGVVRSRVWLVEAGWVVGYCLGIYLVGFLIAIPAFSVAYFKAHKTKWSTTIVETAFVTLFCYLIFSYFLELELYPGLILRRLGLGY